LFTLVLALARGDVGADDVAGGICTAQVVLGDVRVRRDDERVPAAAAAAVVVVVVVVFVLLEPLF
jgi:hypothetical protein